MRLRSLLVLVIACSACGGGGGDRDAGPRADSATNDASDGSTLCALDSDCDDGLFCNGAESCAPSDALADAKGCAPAEDPCLAEQTCDEAERRCLTDCDVSGDADGDGHDSIDCSGDDCDDADPNRFPGNAEVCDVAKHDEDCDPTTFGFRDGDMDGFPDDACCNVDASGVDVCGTDCEDSMPGVHPTEAESCNGIDDNCDGMIDEGLRIDTYHPDCDGDGYGAASSASVMGCGVPVMTPSCTAPSAGATWAPNEEDCDDTNGSVNPGTSEDSCNGIDDNCDGMLSPVEDADRDGFASFTCGGTDCDDAPSSGATTYPGAPEICDRIDNDCSLAGDPGGVDLSEDMDFDRHAPVGAGCSGGFAADDCDDLHNAAVPGGVEVCDGLDNDCDGVVDQEPAASADCTLPNAVSSCVAGVCEVTSCSAGRGDCDLAASNGCEVDLSAELLHCGACGTACHLVCAAGTCDEAVDVVTGDAHSCALRASGKVACWGGNSKGQLGIFASGNQLTPIAVPTISDAVQIAANGNHTCAVHATGRISCWGDNVYGELGDGTTTNRFFPVDVVGITNAVQVATGRNHTCARLTSGEVKCWGYNGHGQLGDGTTTQRLAPVRVLGVAGAGAVDVAAGRQHTCAIDTTGDARCWGGNTYAQLGNGTGPDQTSAMSVPALNNLSAISTSGDHVCVIGSMGVACWGRNTFGQAGGPMLTVPQDPMYLSISDAIAISAGGGHTCAVRASGQVVCWGSNSWGQLGVPTSIATGGTSGGITPIDVPGVTDATRIAAGGAHSCALHATGQLVCWGFNLKGQLGDGTTMPRTAPTNVSPM